jgi:hypothetical protein
MKLPTRGWGPWRQVFYSLHSDPEKAETDLECGVWCNAWFDKISASVYDRWPDLWRRIANLPWPHARTTRKLQKFFPNLR